jgi:glutathione synthase/RimK-type ligase-like ATP-grasp enzyme
VFEKSGEQVEAHGSGETKGAKAVCYDAPIPTDGPPTMHRRSIALVTYEGLPDGTADDRLLLPVLEARGLDARFVSWDAGVDWSTFDAVVLRSTWDYYRKVDDFRAWLGRLQAAGARVFNATDTVLGNVDKRYLRDLERQGVHIVDTEWIEAGQTRDLDAVLRAHGWHEAVVKPAISAGAFETFRLALADAPHSQARVDALARRSALLLQPFLPEIAAKGEWSLVYLDGVFSHATLKRAKSGDFRVQQRWGGTEHAADAPAEVRAAANRIVSLLPDTPLFARVDGVLLGGSFALMELELIEPALFFHAAPHAADRFADALVARL